METARFAAVVEVAAGSFPFLRDLALAGACCSWPPSVLVYAALLSREYWYKLPLNVDRGVGLAVAAVIVTCCSLPLLRPAYGPPGSLVVHRILLVFMFLRHNDSLYDKWLLGYLNLWSFLGS